VGPLWSGERDGSDRSEHAPHATVHSSLVWLAWLAWHSIHKSMMWLRQMAQLSTTMSHAHSATAFHFLISKRRCFLSLPAAVRHPCHPHIATYTIPAPPPPFNGVQRVRANVGQRGKATPAATLGSICTLAGLDPNCYPLLIISRGPKPQLRERISTLHAPKGAAVDSPTGPQHLTGLKGSCDLIAGGWIQPEEAWGCLRAALRDRGAEVPGATGKGQRRQV